MTARLTPIAATLALLLLLPLLAAAAETPEPEPALDSPLGHALDQPLGHALDPILDDWELDLEDYVDEEVGGVVARRRKPLTARSYEHAAKAQGAFGMDVFQVLVDRDNTTNIVFSPMSVGTALAMLFAGSLGQTADQLSAALHLQGAKRDVMHSHRRLKHSRDGVTVAIASDLFTSETLPLNPKFPRYATNMFGSSVTTVPFDFPDLTAELINGQFWNATQGTIEGIVQADMLSEDTQFVLANAVFFKGSWLMSFDEEATAPALFHSPLGPRQVDMMTAEKVFPHADLPELDARALLMPYQGEKLGMLILLPNELDGIDALARHLNMSTVSDVLTRVDGLGDVQVQLPKFDIDAQLDLQPILMKLGVEDLFDPDRANLTRITGQPGTAISTAVHKAQISVSEQGTEASAATAFVSFFRSAPDVIAPFVVDRPFIFVVLEIRTSAVLFLGRVMTLGTELV